MELKPLDFGKKGTSKPIIIAGPCSAETESQVLESAYALSNLGINIFRAGIWKPRTKPGSFQGVGLPGLKWLSKVKEETGMLVATEVATKAHVEAALSHGVDIIWIGARTTGNPFAMQEIAETIASIKKDAPVLVKNPLNPDVEAWIGALERLANCGVCHLGAIHRGFSTYGEHYYRNNPQWGVPLELRTRIPDLTIICDPSHIAGRRDLIAPLSQQALDRGFDGLIIESHCSPDSAWSDKDQQITPPVLKDILNSLLLRDSKNVAEELHQLRERIDELDAQLIDVLSQRMKISSEIGNLKKLSKMPVVQPERYNSILQSRINSALQEGLSPKFMKQIISAIHEESVRVQIDQ
ncbi:MAG: bifunctional 3-deoxy-7-phosphoheptulonate synthase/chorismate mutase type II [Muribaculaceae bacterium]|nr:bifunctional 3-deoxy-7-phosphoheptulonate synthase/chorismate mutase type II [Muribaculaceae bacterium]